MTGILPITVNTVVPGQTAKELFFQGKPTEIGGPVEFAPTEPLGNPQDVGAVVAFVAGPDGAVDQWSDHSDYDGVN